MSDAVFEAMKPPPPRRLGWWLLSWPVFQQQFDSLISEVEGIQARDADGYRNHPKTKLLATVYALVTEGVPLSQSRTRVIQTVRNAYPAG